MPLPGVPDRLGGASGISSQMAICRVFDRTLRTPSRRSGGPADSCEDMRMLRVW